MPANPPKPQFSSPNTPDRPDRSEARFVHLHGSLDHFEFLHMLATGHAARAGVWKFDENAAEWKVGVLTPRLPAVAVIGQKFVGVFQGIDGNADKNDSLQIWITTLRTFPWNWSRFRLASRKKQEPGISNGQSISDNLPNRRGPVTVHTSAWTEVGCEVEKKSPQF